MSSGKVSLIADRSCCLVLTDKYPASFKRSFLGIKKRLFTL